jgi:outer membrane lipoprotein-sorting protein
MGYRFSYPGKKLLLLVIPAFLSSVSGMNQTLSEVLAKHEQATGFSNRQKIRTMISIGTITQMGNTLPVSIIQKRPNKYRFDAHMDEGRITQAYDGIFGWTYNPFTMSDTLLLDGAELAQLRESADFDGILHSYKPKGYAISLQGKVPVGLQTAYKIQVKKPSGETLFLYIDVVSYFVIRSEATLLINGMGYTAESNFSDFRRTAGTILPYHIQSRNGKMITEIQIDTVRINEIMEDFYFKCKIAR